MLGLLAWARALVSANGIVLAMIAGLVTTTLMWDRARIGRAEDRGASKVVEVQRKQTKGLIDEARKARAPAAAPGASQRLLEGKSHCRDC